MRRHFKYLWYIIRHKYYVFVEGRKLKVPYVRLILHDWTKFLPREWFPYAQWFYGGWRQDHYSGESSAPLELKSAYDYAWCHHMHKNDHHWQFWIMIFDVGEEKILPMSDVARREMLADWRGAGRALGFPDTCGWYHKNRDNIRLNEETRAWIEKQLDYAIWYGEIE